MGVIPATETRSLTNSSTSGSSPRISSSNGPKRSSSRSHSRSQSRSHSRSQKGAIQGQLQAESITGRNSHPHDENTENGIILKPNSGNEKGSLHKESRRKLSSAGSSISSKKSKIFGFRNRLKSSS